MRRSHIAIISSCLLISGITFADTTTPVTQSIIPTIPKETPSDLKFTGYLDGSYNYLLRSNHFTSGTHDRVYDLEANGFTLHQAAITLSDQPKQGFGALFNVIAGRDANTLTPPGINPDILGIQNIGVTITQAFLQYTINSFTLLGGKFNCAMGAENYNPTLDTNFSRSILDGYAEPSTLIGIKGIYTINDKLTLAADINNGWDTVKYPGRQKTVELILLYTMNSLFSFSFIGTTGLQPITDGASNGPTGRRNAIDLVGTINATDKLSFIANYDYGMQSQAALPSNNTAKANWQGIAGYVNYLFNDLWQTSVRGEQFYDQNGYRTGVRQNWRELTLTLGYTPKKNIEIRAETRHDFSNVKSFVNINGINVSNNQQSYAIEGIYKF